MLLGRLSCAGLMTGWAHPRGSSCCVSATQDPPRGLHVLEKLAHWDSGLFLEGHGWSPCGSSGLPVSVGMAFSFLLLLERAADTHGE